jgi:hypothetical protein
VLQLWLPAFAHSSCAKDEKDADPNRRCQFGRRSRLGMAPPSGAAGPLQAAHVHPKTLINKDSAVATFVATKAPFCNRKPASHLRKVGYKWLFIKDWGHGVIKPPCPL